MMKSLEDKVIVVTGAGVFGRTFVQRIASEGSTAIVAGLNLDAAQMAVASCPAA